MSVKGCYSDSFLKDVFRVAVTAKHVDDAREYARQQRRKIGTLRSVRSAHYTGTDGRKVRAS